MPGFPGAASPHAPPQELVLIVGTTVWGMSHRVQVTMTAGGHLRAPSHQDTGAGLLLRLKMVSDGPSEDWNRQGRKSCPGWPS